MSEPITTYNGRVIMFNNGVVDVVQGETSLVDENKVAHIPQSSVAIDNETIIENANHQLEVPIDEDTIYMDDHGFMKAKGGEGKTYTAGEHIVINSEGIISAEWPVIPEQKEYTGGTDIEVTSEGVINYAGSGGGKEYTAGANIQINSEGVISATDTTYSAGTGITIDNNVISTPIPSFTVANRGMKLTVRGGP